MDEEATNSAHVEVTNPGGDIRVVTTPAGTRPTAELTPAAAGDELAADRIRRTSVDTADDGSRITVRVPDMPAATTGPRSGVVVSGNGMAIQSTGNVVISNGGITVNGMQITGGGSVQLGGQGSVLVTLHLPEGAHLRADSTGGSVCTTGRLGVVTVATTGGDLRIQRADELDLDTSGGDIQLGTVAGSARARTSGGDVTADRLLGGGDLRTSGGDVRAHLAAGCPLNARTSGGDVRITTGPGVSTDHVHARTSGGNTSIREQRS